MKETFSEILGTSPVKTTTFEYNPSLRPPPVESTSQEGFTQKKDQMQKKEEPQKIGTH